MSNAFVCIMGVGTVFFGLICLIFITSIVSAICKVIEKPQAQAKSAAAPAAPAIDAPIENKQEIVAAVCAAIAEDLGTDASNIRVTSFKKL